MAPAGGFWFGGGVAFRHELASLLMLDGPLPELLAGAPDRDLARYLVLAHHGKLRVQVRDPGDLAVLAPGEASGHKLLGLEEGSVVHIPPLLGQPAAELIVDLDLFLLGGERSWTRTALGLRDRYGPFVLAYLETLVRIADWRASAGAGVPRRQALRSRGTPAPGLRPEPLASYLAGLGLIRVIGEQADPAVTAAWTPDGLAITTTVNDIAAWLADEYVPTPVLSPWNSGSGFGAKDKEPLRALEAMLAHPSARLDPLKAAIPVARHVVGKARERGWITTSAPGRDKGRVVQEFRNRCPDALLPWIDAAVVLAGEDTVFPPLLGTGGNDGRLDFSTNFHQRLLDVIAAPGSGRARSLGIARDLINGTEAEQLASAAVGQFDPASAGGPGSSRFGAAESLVNPWGYVLLVEGACCSRPARCGGTSMPPDGPRCRSPCRVPRTGRPAARRAKSRAARSGHRCGRGSSRWRRSRRYSPRHARPGVAARPGARSTSTPLPAPSAWPGASASSPGTACSAATGGAFAAVPVDHVGVREQAKVRLAAEVEDWAARFGGSDTSAAVGQAARRFQAAHLEYARDGGALPLARLLAALTGLEQAVGRSGRARDASPVR